MQEEQRKNLTLIAGAAVILMLANLGIWAASSEGYIAPAVDQTLWFGFVTLNVAYLLWAMAMLGLQPMLVSLSYLAGGGLAFAGAQGVGGVGMADVAAAGASYGAFGALTLGGFSSGRLAFFNRRQMPFMFLTMLVLMLSAALLGNAPAAGGNVLMGTLVAPFVIGGAAISLMWTVANRVCSGRIRKRVSVPEVSKAEEREDVPVTAEAMEVVEEGEAAMLLQVPVHAEPDEEEFLSEDDVDEQEVKTEPKQEPVVAAKAPAREEAPEADTDFYPLEIDNEQENRPISAGTELTSLLAEMNFDSEEDEPFAEEVADDGLAFDALLEDAENHLLDDDETELPALEDPIETDPLVHLSEDLLDAASDEPLDESSEDLMRHELEEPPVSTPVEREAPSSEAKKSDDWLSDHLDLLNRLKH